MEITNSGVGVRFKFGLEVDLPITEDRYFFATGLIYAPKRVGYMIEDFTTSSKTEEVYKSQYLQIPLTLKLFTSEFIPDVKGYFQLGFLSEVKIYSEALDDSYSLIEDFKPLCTIRCCSELSSPNSPLYSALKVHRIPVSGVRNWCAAMETNSDLL